MSPIVEAFLISAFLPAVVATIALFVLGGMKEPLRSPMQALVIALAFMAGSYLLLKRMNFPPKDVNESFGWAALLLAFFVAMAPRSLNYRYGLRALFVIGVGSLLLWHIGKALLNSPPHHRNMLAFFFLGLGVWSIMERTSNRVKPLTLMLLPLIVASALSIYALLSGSAVFSQLVTILCALIGGSLVLGWMFPKRLSTVAWVPFLSVFIIGFMAAVHFYLGTNPWQLIWLCIPFALLWIRGWLKFIPANAVIEAVIFAILSIIPLGALLWTHSKTVGPLY